MNWPVNTTVAWLTFRQLFVRKRLVAAVILALTPLLIVMLFMSTRGAATAGGRTAGSVLVSLYQDVVLGVLLPLSAVVFGTAAFGGEIDDGTIVYLLVKPLRRWRVVLSKYVVAVIATAGMMVVATIPPWLFLGTGAVAPKVVIAFAAAIALGAALYSALFVTMGMMSRRALVFGLLYIVVLEMTLSRQVAGVRSLAIREFAMTVVGKLAAGEPGVVAGTVSLDTVWTMGGLILVGMLALGMRWLSRYEMAEKL